MTMDLEWLLKMQISWHYVFWQVHLPDGMHYLNISIYFTSAHHVQPTACRNIWVPASVWSEPKCWIYWCQQVNKVVTKPCMKCMLLNLTNLCRPLHLSAALVNVPEITHLLLTHDAKIDARNSAQSTPLFAACKANNPGIASKLIDRGKSCSKSLTSAIVKTPMWLLCL